VFTNGEAAGKLTAFVTVTTTGRKTDKSQSKNQEKYIYKKQFK